MSNPAGYDLSIFNLPKVGGMAAVKRTEYQPAPTAKEPASKFSIRKSSASDTPPNMPLVGSNPGNNARGYDLSAFGLPEKVEMPKYGSDGKETETVHVRDWGRKVRADVEAALNRSPQEGFNRLFHAIGSAEGLQLMSPSALTKFKQLGQGFLAAKNPRLFFTTELVSFFNSLAPTKRSK